MTRRQSQVWKAAERRVAKTLGGTRNARGKDFSQRLPDVEHVLFSVEVKHRKKLPQLWREGLDQAARYSTKPPLLVIHEQGTQTDLVCLRLKDFVDLFGPLHVPAGGGDA